MAGPTAPTALEAKVIPLDQAVRVFVAARPQLMRTALRILRDPAEAEDVVQDAWLRWQLVDRAAVLNAQAFLTTTTSRLALNQLQSARRRRETPVDVWAHEPVDSGDGPETETERLEAVEEAVRLMLATLLPNERAALVLREAFGYGYDQIAGLLGLGTAHCRQLVCRAKRRLSAEPRDDVSANRQRQLVRAFRAAAGGEMGGLERLLLTDARRAA